MSRKIAFLLFVALFAGAAPAGAGTANEEIVTIPTRDGVTLPFILLGPRTGDPPAVILFAGGRGVINLAEWNRQGDPTKNFLVRSRKLFAAQGFLVAVPDAPSDLIGADGLAGARLEEEHARDIRAVIRRLRRFTQGPVFLVGTSRGTISAAGVAARAPAGELGGIVLTATVTRLNNRGDKDHVFKARLENIRVPVLIAGHEEDGCYVTPFEDSARLKRALSAAPSVEIKGYSGGGPYRGRECGSRHAHGFPGIEAQVVADIAAWIKSQAASVPKP